MVPLLLSMAALVGAPVLASLLRGRAGLVAFADGLVQTVIAGLVLVHVLPFAVAHAGGAALAALAVGFFAGLAAHRLPGGDRSAGTLAGVALLVHAAVDGVALATTEAHEDHGASLLGWAVVLHTLPVGLATWRLAAPRIGGALTWALLIATAASTALGWIAAETMLVGTSPAIAGLTQCAVAGMLLHMLGHLGENATERPSGWGALVGIGVVALVGWVHPLPGVVSGELEAGRALITLLLEAAPALLLGYVAAGLLHAFAPASLPQRLRGGNDWLSAARGAALGLPVPVCSCGALPVYRGLIDRGAPPPAAMAFLVAGPEVGIATLFVSVPLLGAELTVVRLAAAVVVALVTGALVGRLVPAQPPQVVVEGGVPLRERVREAVRYGFVETVDHTAVWVLFGLLVAALAEPLMAPDALAGVPGPVGVVIAALIGVPMYVCASGATPLAAVLLHKGLSPGAAIAFLLTGPATNVSTFGVLGRMHGEGVAARFGAAVALTAVALGVGIDAVGIGMALPALHDASAHDHGWIEVVSAAALALLFAAALVRRGPGGLVEPLIHPHAHEHDDCCDAGHSHAGHSHAGHSHAGHGHGAHAHHGEGCGCEEPGTPQLAPPVVVTSLGSGPVQILAAAPPASVLRPPSR
jgi:uncharacterized membrane protein YraQ (UPF0718 family)